jgi:hypothetical protein
MGVISLATKLVIPAAAERRAGIQKRHCDYWIPAFARMTGWWISVALFNCQFNNYRVSSGLLTAWIPFCKPDSSTRCLRNVSDLVSLLNFLAGKTLGFRKIEVHDSQPQALHKAQTVPIHHFCHQKMGPFHYLTNSIHEPQFRIWFEFGFIFHDINTVMQKIMRERMLRIISKGKKIISIENKTLKDAGYLEREDLQKMICSSETAFFEEMGEDLFLINVFDSWKVSGNLGCSKGSSMFLAI